MRHKKAGRKLGRTTSHRVAMLRNMVTSLFEHERIHTTDAKAKELRPLAEKMITLAKKGDLHSKRQVFSVLRNRKVAAKLFYTVAKRFTNRQGGYLRIIKIGRRHGDNAPISIVELIREEEVLEEKIKSKVKKKKTRKKAAAPIAEKEEAKIAESSVTEEKQVSAGDQVQTSDEAGTDAAASPPETPSETEKES